MEHRRCAVSLHPSHVTRVSIDASTYDQICVNCDNTDLAIGGWGKLAEPCPKPVGKGGMTLEQYYEEQKKNQKSRV